MAEKILYAEDIQNAIDTHELVELYNQQDFSNIQLKDLLILAKYFESVFKKISNKTVKQNKFGSYGYDGELVNSSEIGELMTVGAKLVYLIRTVLLGQTIDYSLGGYGPDGKTLYTVTVPQSEILPNLQANLNTQAVQLDSWLEKSNNAEAVNAHLQNLWNSINSLLDPGDTSSKNKRGISLGPKYSYTNKQGQIFEHQRRFYQKNDRDINVHVSYRGAHRKKYTYYKLKDQDFTFINTGWIYEWFMEYISQADAADHIANLEQQISNPGNMTPLSGFIKKTDNYAGYTGGDYIANGQQQIQAKFQNLKVISFKSIVNVIISVNNILKQYQNATSQEAKERQINKLKRLFTNEETMSILDTSIDSKINKLLSELTT